MSRPTHILKHEHRVIEQAMRALEGMCLRLKAGYDIPHEDLEKLLDFINNFADRYHHAKEEAYLFPELEKIGIRNQNGPIAFLRDEHVKERRLLQDLQLAIEDYRYNPAAGDKIIAAAMDYKNHLVGHIEQEDGILFSLAEEMMDDPLKNEVTHRLVDVSNERHEMVERYEKIATELEKSWSI